LPGGKLSAREMAHHATPVARQIIIPAVCLIILNVNFLAESSNTKTTIKLRLKSITLPSHDKAGA
jgi:hypothetical protein